MQRVVQERPLCSLLYFFIDSVPDDLFTSPTPGPIEVSGVDKAPQEPAV